MFAKRVPEVRIRSTVLSMRCPFSNTLFIPSVDPTMQRDFDRYEYLIRLKIPSIAKGTIDMIHESLKNFFPAPFKLSKLMFADPLWISQDSLFGESRWSRSTSSSSLPSIVQHDPFMSQTFREDKLEMKDIIGKVALGSDGHVVMCSRCRHFALQRIGQMGKERIAANWIYSYTRTCICGSWWISLEKAMGDPIMAFSTFETTPLALDALSPKVDPLMF